MTNLPMPEIDSTRTPELYMEQVISGNENLIISRCICGNYDVNYDAITWKFE